MTSIIAQRSISACHDGPPGNQSASFYPRGLFRQNLSNYSRDLKLFPLKMPSLTAHNFHLDKCGMLAVGNCADVVVFDPVTVKNVADYNDPTAVAEGINEAIVNGQLTWLHGQHLGTRAGQVVTRSTLMTE